jgi:Domain of unknown function (DUF389)
VVLEEKDGAAVRELLKEHKVLEHRQLRLPDGEVLVRILLDAEQNEAVLDLLEKHYTGAEGNRAVILPVEATLPRPSNRRPRRTAGADRPRGVVRGHQGCRAVFAGLSGDGGVVHHRGGHRLDYNSVAIIIGAMVIAPLLGSNMALALGTTLGDLPLLWRAFRTSLAGIATAMALSAMLGMLLQVNPASPEMASRNGVGVGDVVVALASGSAGALHSRRVYRRS